MKAIHNTKLIDKLIFFLTKRCTWETTKRILFKHCPIKSSTMFTFTWQYNEVYTLVSKLSFLNCKLRHCRRTLVNFVFAMSIGRCDDIWIKKKTDGKAKDKFERKRYRSTSTVITKLVHWYSNTHLSLIEFFILNNYYMQVCLKRSKK